MSMSLAISTDYGLTWKDYGFILTGTDSPAANKITGEDCVGVIVQDGCYYAYCLRYRDGKTIVARAPVSDPGPGRWMKFFHGKWDQPGLGGDATGLARGVGNRGALWTTTGETLLLGWEQTRYDHASDEPRRRRLPAVPRYPDGRRLCAQCSEWSLG